jgi:predicted nucleic acid-binding protein
LIPKILVDTSLWIEFFKNASSTKTAALKKLISIDQVVIAGPVLVELYQGARSLSELKGIKTALSVLHALDTNESIWEKGGMLSFELKRKGLTMKTMDIILASLAIHHNCYLYSLDKDFETIARYSNLMLYNGPGQTF